MEDKFNSLIEKIRKSRMTAVENARLKLRIMTSLSDKLDKREPILSPYNTKKSPYYFSFSFRSFGKLVPVSALVLLLAAGGLSYASADALPGDFLYSVKINIKENIEEKLTFAPKEKIALRQKRIEDRFLEVEKLIKEKRITSENRSIAESEIQIEKEKIGKDIEEINKENPQAAEEAKKELESSIQERREQIDTHIEEDQDIESIEKDLTEFEEGLDKELEIELSVEEEPVPVEKTEEENTQETETQKEEADAPVKADTEI